MTHDEEVQRRLLALVELAVLIAGVRDLWWTWSHIRHRRQLERELKVLRNGQQAADADRERVIL